MSTQHCRSCRHHSKESRERQVGQTEFDSDMEMGRFHDGSPEDVEAYGPEQFEHVFSCMKQGAKLIGIGDEAGVGCSIWEVGSRGGIDPELAARLERRDQTSKRHEG